MSSASFLIDKSWSDIILWTFGPYSFSLWGKERRDGRKCPPGGRNGKTTAENLTRRKRGRLNGQVGAEVGSLLSDTLQLLPGPLAATRFKNRTVIHEASRRAYFDYLVPLQRHVESRPFVNRRNVQCHEPVRTLKRLSTFNWIQRQSRGLTGLFLEWWLCKNPFMTGVTSSGPVNVISKLLFGTFSKLVWISFN